VATAAKEKPKAAGANARYPWDKWEDGKRHTIAQGTDYPATIAPSVMRGMVLRRAYAKGRDCESTVDGDKVTFQFLGPRNSAEAKARKARKAAKKAPAKKAKATKPAKKAAKAK